MKVIIAGGRDFNNSILVNYTIGQFYELNGIYPTEIVCGMAKGADMEGYSWAKKFNIPIKEFPADWNLYGKSAGYKRNKQMAEYADYLIAFWDGKSKGTKHMIDLASRQQIGVMVVQY